jgi:DNA-directed RNA polymerase subunit RPC12/RpoP
MSINKYRLVKISSWCELVMAEVCPHCGGKLIEKHEETEVEPGKTTVYIFFRCVSCGKWTKKEKKEN